MRIGLGLCNRDEPVSQRHKSAVRILQEHPTEHGCKIETGMGSKDGMRRNSAMMMNDWLMT